MHTAPSTISQDTKKPDMGNQSYVTRMLATLQTDVANEADREERKGVNELTSSRKFPDTHGRKNKIDVCLSANSLSAHKKMGNATTANLPHFEWTSPLSSFFPWERERRALQPGCKAILAAGGARRGRGHYKKRGSGPMQLSILCPTPGARRGKVR